MRVFHGPKCLICTEFHILIYQVFICVFMRFRREFDFYTDMINIRRKHPLSFESFCAFARYYYSVAEVETIICTVLKIDVMPKSNSTYHVDMHKGISYNNVGCCMFVLTVLNKIMIHIIRRINKARY